MIVGYESALSYWRATRVAYGAQQVLEPEGRTYGARPLSISEQTALALNLCADEKPLQVVISDKRGRHTYASIENHVWRGPLTADYLVSLGSGIHVCRMPVVLCQLATMWDEVELAEVACEMMGTYGLTPWTERGSTGDLEPLLDVAEIRGYASSARALGIRGASKVLGSLSLVASSSNSPRETAIAIFFLRGRPLGGAALGGFAMNKRIALPDRLARVLKKKSIAPDFSWPNGTVVEYDSRQEHDDPETRARDEEKRRAYQAEGLDCLTLTNGILRSNARLNYFVSDLERSLGLPRRPLSKKMEERRRDLRERLFGSESIEASLDALNGAGTG